MASNMRIAAWCLICAAVHLTVIREYAPRHFIDDGAFFFRYAENLAADHGYRFNPDESPVLGASAPLWPIVLAAGVWAGLSVQNAAIVIGATLTIASTLLLALAAYRIAGRTAAVLTAAFFIVNSRVTCWATVGMETPLTMLLISTAIHLTVVSGRMWLIGAFAGLLVVHKLDLLPLAVLMLLLGRRETGRRWQAAVVAALVVGAWVAVAVAYFGSPIPNSVTTKLAYASRETAFGWYARESLLTGCRAVFTMLVPLALIGPPDRRPVLRVWAGFIALTVGGYTLFPPPEPYDWYPASVQPALSFLAGIGLGGLLVVGAEHFSLTDRRRQAVSAVVVAASFGIALLIETPEKHRQRSYVDTVERDRQAAGEWIDRHAPADARVLTGFGNIAYFGRRTTIDASFLNRRGPLLPLEQLIAEHQPEYVAVCPYLSGTPPERFVPPDGYAVATVIDRTRKESGLDFYVVVMQRAIPTTRPSAPTAFGRRVGGNLP